MVRIKWIVFFFLLLPMTHSAFGIAPGGIYRDEESIKLTLEPSAWPRKLGYGLIRGTVHFHGRKTPFSSGVFLPAAFFHSNAPLPLLMALHNKSAVGSRDSSSLAGEGMGQLLGHGRPDGRAAGDTAENPISLREEAQFIGLVPQCPPGTGWDSPPVVHILNDFIDQAIAAYHADVDRIYLTGFSYGASSTWQIALALPNRFAAIIICDGRASPDPVHDVARLKNVAIYLEVGQWDGPFVAAADVMHQALNTLPHNNYIFRMIPGGNHFCYQTVYTDPQVWKWVYAQHRRSRASSTTSQVNP